MITGGPKPRPFPGLASERRSLLNLEILSGWPSGPPFVGDYLGSESRASRFYEGGFQDQASYREKAREVDARFPQNARARALSLVQSATPAAAARLQRFVHEGGFFVTTGQQPGLFSGPLYSLYKALTAIRLAAALEPILERPVLALFWVASEDHDWDEVDHTHLLDLQNELATFRVPPQEGLPNRPLHRIPLERGLDETREAFLSALPETDFSVPLSDFLREAYPGGSTLPQGFSALFQELLKALPLAFVDSAHPGLKAASLPVLFRAWEEAEPQEGILSRGASHLEDEGYHVQVPILEKGVNLFFEGGAGRDRIYREGGKVRLNRAGSVLDWDEVRARAEDDPTLLSPNVLLRPVVESFLFPTLAYVGGPGELAYFGQLRDLFRSYDIRMPVIHPRRSATLVEGKIGKVLSKFHRSVETLDRPFHELAAEFAQDEVPPEVRRALGDLRGAVGKGAGALSKAVQEIDPTLKGPVTHARNTAFAAFDETERKILQALKRENEIALEQLGKAQRHLYPFGKPQERALNAFYYLTRYGPELIPRLVEGFAVDLGIQTA